MRRTIGKVLMVGGIIITGMSLGLIVFGVTCLMMVG